MARENHTCKMHVAGMGWASLSLRQCTLSSRGTRTRRKRAEIIHFQHINTLTNLEHIAALENAENAYEALLYTRVIANSCPRPMDNTRANKNTALSIIETEVLEKWETTVTQNDTLYQSACVQHINVMLHKWVTALFDTYDTAKQITTNPKRAATNTLPSRPQLANKMCTETTILEKQLKTELLRYCPQTVESNLNRVTCTSQNWTWTTIKGSGNDLAMMYV